MQVASEHRKRRGRILQRAGVVLGQRPVCLLLLGVRHQECRCRGVEHGSGCCGIYGAGLMRDAHAVMSGTRCTRFMQACNGKHGQVLYRRVQGARMWQATQYQSTASAMNRRS